MSCVMFCVASLIKEHTRTLNISGHEHSTAERTAFQPANAQNYTSINQMLFLYILPPPLYAEDKIIFFSNKFLSLPAFCTLLVPYIVI